MPQLQTGEEGLGTPSNYATDQQLAQQRLFAQQLLKESGSERPIVSPWQGVAKMVQALTGGYGLSSSALQEQARREAKSGAWGNTGLPPPSQGQVQPQPASIPSATGQAPATAASVRTNNPGAQNIGPTALAYGATGSQTIAGGNHIAVFHDPIDGGAAHLSGLDKNFTGMPAINAISKWATGSPNPTPNSMAYAQFVAKRAGIDPKTVITPEFLRSPQGLKFAQAMADWEAGGKYPMSDDQWQAAHAKAFGAPQRGPQLAYNNPGLPQGGGPQSLSAPPMGAEQGQPAAAPQQSASAGPQVAAGPRPSGGPTPPLAGSTGATPQGGPSPGLVTQRPQMSRKDYQTIMSLGSDEEKALATKIYMEQGQPLEAKIADRGSYVINPRTGQQQWNGNTIKSIVKTKGGEMELLGVWQPDGTIKWVSQPFGEEEGPTGGPATPGPTMHPPGTKVPEEPTEPPAGIPKGGAGTPPVKGASEYAKADEPIIDPTFGGAIHEDGEAPTMLGQGPPGTGATVAQAPPSGAPNGTGIKVAAAGDPASALKYLQKKGLQYHGQEEAITQDQKLLAENADAYMAAGNKSMVATPELQYAKKLVEDPATQQGILYPLKYNAARLLNSLNLAGPEYAAQNEALQKIIKSNLLGQLRGFLEKTGQARASELKWMEDSSADSHNTREANTAVMELQIRTAQRLSEIGQLTAKYMNHERVNEKGQWVKSNEENTNAGLKQYINQYYEEHPILSKKEVENYKALFEADKKFGSKQGTNLPLPKATPSGTPVFKEGSSTPPPGYR